eukprot:5618959-Pyramimonas_sp.AAC.1
MGRLYLPESLLRECLPKRMRIKRSAYSPYFLVGSFFGNCAITCTRGYLLPVPYPSSVGPIRRRRRGNILTTDQSHEGTVSRGNILTTDQSHEGTVSRGNILTTDQSHAGT